MSIASGSFVTYSEYNKKVNEIGLDIKGVNERIDSIKYTKTDFYTGGSFQTTSGSAVAISKIEIQNPYPEIERDIIVQVGINGRVILNTSSNFLGVKATSEDAASEIYLYLRNMVVSKGQIGFKGIHDYRGSLSKFIAGSVSLGWNLKSSVTETLELKHACVNGYNGYTASKIDNWWVRVDQIFKNGEY